MISLKRLTLKDKDSIESFVSKVDPYSDFNFISLYSWSLHSQTMFYLNHGMLLLKLPDYNSQEYIFSFMILDNFKTNFSHILNYFKKNRLPLSFSLLPEYLVPNLRNFLDSQQFNYKLKEDRGDFDYLIDIKNTLAATGHEYADYRYKLSKFARTWADQIEPYSFDANNEKDIKQAELLLKEWVLSKKSNETNYEFESLAFSRFLQIAQGPSNKINYKAFTRNGALVALSSYEVLNSNQAVGHFIKYSSKIPNLFYYLVNETCKDANSLNIRELNIEQDLDIATLRASKMHLRPSGFLKKYTLEIDG